MHKPSFTISVSIDPLHATGVVRPRKKKMPVFHAEHDRARDTITELQHFLDDHHAVCVSRIIITIDHHLLPKQAVTFVRQSRKLYDKITQHAKGAGG